MRASSTRIAEATKDVLAWFEAGSCLVYQRRTIHVLIINVFRTGLAACDEPLQAKRRHPDRIVLHHGIPTLGEAVDALALQHVEPVLHVVVLDIRQRATGRELENIDAHIELGAHRHQHLQQRAGVAQKGLFRHFALV
jgi:hypothetical protein